MKPRVLLWYWGRRGGGPQYCYEIARVLAAHDDIELHTSISRQSEFFDQIAALGLPGMTVDTYSDLANAAAAVARIPFVRAQFMSYLRKERIDIVYCPMTHLWNMAMLWPFAGENIKYLLTSHDFTPHPGEVEVFRRGLMLYETKFANGIVTLSQWVRYQLREYGFKGPICTILHPPFYFRHRPASRRSFPAGRPIRILFFGRILAYKGVDLLIESFKLLRERGYDVELYIQGGGDIGPFQAQINGLGKIHVENRWFAEDEVPDIIGAADIVALPYKEASQSGVAAACQGLGVPVVGTPVGGMEEQINKAGIGIVSEDITAAGFAGALAKLLDTPKLYEYYANKYDGITCDKLWQNAGDKICASIHDLLDISKSSPGQG